MLMRALSPQPGQTYLDIGCGEGRVMGVVAKAGARALGIDLSHTLATLATKPVAVARARSLPLKKNSCDGAYSVLTLEHVPDHSDFFEEAARVVKPGGSLALVMNHPVWTSPDSTPITDTDGEVLWRPGDYFSHGSTTYPAGEGSIVFHHRSLASLLNVAAEAKWSLEHVEEAPHHELDDQAGIPRLLACRWRLLP